MVTTASVRNSIRNKQKATSQLEIRPGLYPVEKPKKKQSAYKAVMDTAINNLFSQIIEKEPITYQVGKSGKPPTSIRCKTAL